MTGLLAGRWGRASPVSVGGGLSCGRRATIVTEERCSKNEGKKESRRAALSRSGRPPKVHRAEGHGAPG